MLVERVKAATASLSYTTGPLSPDEACLAAFAQRLRSTIPEAAPPHPPEPRA